ncbi:anti-sigma-I factor RsgI family protein [Blautia sp. MSJ-19]|uniref:anti-sigma-I factor RsgI family protein n=1 Tax=Blautia sp. MSJ-19 TaxID=2841517 RepID=UPI001C0F3658|nr:anti-sigma factor domain-containing protein [Blautia sp. MSJ-19]MBU5482036.1 anti-sigma factor domain-containing protein [Blautia sp. MSJ-19]
MKAVVLEIRKNEAAVLCEDGQIVKIRRNGLAVGDSIDISDAEICPDKKVVFYKKLRQYGSVAAAAALLLGFGGSHVYNTAIACSYVSLDINPSIEYTLNRQDCVLDVTAVNKDAEEIVEQLKEQGIKKEPLADAISMTAEILQENGYIIEDETDYILINVASDSDKKSESLKKEAQGVFDKMNIDNEENIHLTMTDSTVSERKEARELGISAGEYKEIKAIGDEDVSKYKDMKVKELLETSGELPSSSADSKQAETSEKEPKSNSDSKSEKKDENSRQSNSSKADTNDDQKSSRQESQQNDQSSTNNNTEAGQNSRAKQTTENQSSQNIDQNNINQNDTGDDTGNNAGQTRTEQSKTDNNTGNFGQLSGNSHVEDAQNSVPQQNQDNGGAGVSRQEPDILE